MRAEERVAWSTRAAAQRLAQLGVDGLCRICGRRQVVRAARFALNRSRLDVPNSMSRNGESALQAWFIRSDAGGGPRTVLDIGANKGVWSRALYAAGRASETAALRVHAFEPSAHTCSLLRANLADLPVSVHQVALSDQSGDAVLRIAGPAAGTNSLHAQRDDSAESATEVVQTSTIDAFAAEHGLTHLDFVKIDTEGHDFRVLSGGLQLFEAQRIELVQFEYNHRWILARAYLRDAFELLEGCGYSLGKVTPKGIEFYPHWEPDLETFVEGNYLACTRPVRDQLPAVRWWKDLEGRR